MESGLTNLWCVWTKVTLPIVRIYSGISVVTPKYEVMLRLGDE